MIPLIYATCGPEYYDIHGAAFRKSAEQHGHECRIDVVRDNYPALMQKFGAKQPKTFFASLRWFLLPEMLDEYPAILVCDIDSIFNSRVEFEDEFDMGLFYRPWLQDGLKILCSASYWTPRAKPFAERIRERLFQTSAHWGCDQEEMWKEVTESGAAYNIKWLDRSFLNYHFDLEAPIWTAKGPNRKSDPVYLERKALYA